MIRIGIGTDIHRLEAGRPLIIGGVEIGSEFGAAGHSDADVLLHAITDAVLGSLALGDIGQHFPDGDERWKGADSLTFLRHAKSLINDAGFSIANIDCVVDLESPRLRPHIQQMRENIAAALSIEADRVSIKAKTGEMVDAVGEGRAIRAQAVVLISRNSVTSE